MEKNKRTEVSIDLYPGIVTHVKNRSNRVNWNMLDPKPMNIILIDDNRWIEIEFNGEKYITDRVILKGIL